MDIYFIKIVNLISLILLFSCGGIIGFFIFYYLPKFEKEHNIQVLTSDFYLVRLERISMLACLALMNPKGRLFARFERKWQFDWYAQQYLKLPREKFKPFVFSLYVSIFIFALMCIGLLEMDVRE